MKGCHTEMQASVSSHNITYVPDCKIYVEIFKLMVSTLTERILKFDIRYNTVYILKIFPVGKDGVSSRLGFQLYIMLMLGNGENCSPLLLYFIISCYLDTGKSNRNVKPLRCLIKKKQGTCFFFSFGKSDTM